jgi:hypothetical protein
VEKIIFQGGFEPSWFALGLYKGHAFLRAVFWCAAFLRLIKAVDEGSQCEAAMMG